MNINEFSDDYLNELLDKISKENKTIFLLGDFNITTFFSIFYSLVGLQPTPKH